MFTAGCVTCNPSRDPSICRTHMILESKGLGLLFICRNYCTESKIPCPVSQCPDSIPTIPPHHLLSRIQLSTFGSTLTPGSNSCMEGSNGFSLRYTNFPRLSLLLWLRGVIQNKDCCVLSSLHLTQSSRPTCTYVVGAEAFRALLQACDLWQEAAPIQLRSHC
jgi:hypothetical protein